MKTMIRFIIPLFCFASVAYTSTAVTKLLLNGSDEFRDPKNANGKYVNLLHVICVSQDRDTYGPRCDWGYWAGSSWGPYTDLKPGFWVYVYPNWYVLGKTGGRDRAQPPGERPGQVPGFAPRDQGSGRRKDLRRVL